MSIDTIKNEFKQAGIAIDNAAAKYCVKLCSELMLDAASLLKKWEAFAINNEVAECNVLALEKLGAEIARKQQFKSKSTKPGQGKMFDKHTIQSLDSGMLEMFGVTAPAAEEISRKRKLTTDAAPRTAPALRTPTTPSFLTPSSHSSALPSPYDARKSAGQSVEEWKAELGNPELKRGQVVVDVAEEPHYTVKAEGFRYMNENPIERFQVSL
tara:strand:- start:153 stop:788 length:636 start_codon:yes stop_codon:yes gene_type:complete